MFKKIVSSLIYSPAMIWKLSRLGTKLDQEKKDTIQAIVILMFSLIAIILSALLINNSTNNNLTLKPTTKIDDLSIKLSTLNQTKSRLLNFQSKVSNNETIIINIDVKNTSTETITTDLAIDYDDAKDYFELINSSEFKTTKDQLSINIDNLKPEQSVNKQLLLRAKNYFPTTPQRQTSNDCVANIYIPNNKPLSINLKCPITKQLDLLGATQNPNDNFKYLLTIIVIVVALIVVKVVYLIRILITKHEIKEIRNYINSETL